MCRSLPKLVKVKILCLVNKPKNPVVEPGFLVLVIQKGYFRAKSIMAVITDNIKLNIKADKTFCTSKPSRMASAKYIIIMLMTSKNNPKVKIVIGMVKNTNIGLTIALSKASTKANNMPSVILATVIPGIKRDIKTAAIPVKISLRINPSICYNIYSNI